MRTCAFGMIFGAAAVGLRNVQIEGDAVTECDIGGFGIADGAHIVVAGGGDNGVGRDGFHFADKASELVVAVSEGVENFIQLFA